MAVNTAGFQLVADHGLPQIITLQAASTISGGEYVYAGSKVGPVSSGANSFVTNDIIALSPASGTNFPIGVAVHNAASGTNNYVAVLQKGIVISPVDGNTTAGVAVSQTNGAHAVAEIGSNATLSTANYQRVVGKALASAASGTTNFTLVRLDL